MTRHYLSLSVDVNPTSTQIVLSACTELITKHSATEIYMLLSTPGGSVMHGITMYNVLRGLPAKIITHNVGAVNSIGNVIFLAGEERYTCPNASFMFHGVGFDIRGQARFEEKDLRERLGGVVADQKKIASVISDRTMLTDQEVAALFLEATTKDATYAKDKGIVHDITPLSIPAGAPIHQLVVK